jgi:hypothetical protein
LAAAALLGSPAGGLPEPGIGSTARAADAQSESGVGNRRSLKDPVAPRPWDIDGDAIANRRDRDMDGDRICNRRDRDVDGDGRTNARDPDIDGDGTVNGRDRDADGDGSRNTRDRDVDGDRHTNLRDWDIDGDRVENAFDPDSDASGDAGYGGTITAGRPPPGFLGVVSDYAFWDVGPTPARAHTLAAIAASGAGLVRQAFDWSIIEPRPGAYDFDRHDRFVAAATAYGLTVMPVVTQPPQFRARQPERRTTSSNYLPASNAEFAAFAAGLVQRYGPNGSFWSEHPELPPRPIRSWQIWNEPNIPAYWPGGPSPEAYAAMLRKVGHAIKSVDPAAEVVTAGINDSELGMPLSSFLKRMYAAGARGSFDTLALNAYAPASDLVIDLVRRAVTVLRRHADPAHVHITELGWATGGRRSKAYVVDEVGQAALTRRTLFRLANLRRVLRLDGVVYYSWRDASPCPGAQDHWGLHTGLLRHDGHQKPALRAFSSAAR